MFPLARRRGVITKGAQNSVCGIGNTKFRGMTPTIRIGVPPTIRLCPNTRALAANALCHNPQLSTTSCGRSGNSLASLNARPINGLTFNSGNIDGVTAEKCANTLRPPTVTVPSSIVNNPES